MKTKNYFINTTSLHFLKKSFYLLIFLIFFVLSCSPREEIQSHVYNLPLSSDMRSGLNPQRLTIAMWDYSWLTMHYTGGAFENFDKVTDDLLQRGFNTVRIDAFPLIIGKLENNNQQVTILANPLANWGPADKEREHAIVNEFISFMKITKEKNINVILSTWNNGCKEFPEIRKYYQTKSAYWEAWEKTLNILLQNNLLDHVLYVDLDQEFPNFSPLKFKIDQLADQVKPSSETLAIELAKHNSNDLEKLDWNQAQMVLVHDHIQESLLNFHIKYPQLRFTFSFTDHWDEFRAMNLNLLDVLELHIWMEQSERFNSRSRFNDLKKDRGQHDYTDYMKRLNQTMESVRPMLIKDMHNRLAYAKEWSEELAAPLTTTEAWGPWWHMDQKDLEWKWLYDWCEECMKLSGQYGFWGSTPWNFSHPYWKNWSDTTWYKRVNSNFLKSELKLSH